MTANVRNVIIVLVLAALVAIVPGGGTVARVLLEAVYLAFLGGLAWVASITYREHRGALYLLGTNKRMLLYAAITVLAVTVTATSRLWNTSAGSVAWLILVGLAIYAGCAVLWAARRY
ncbi:MAG: hypothetical protein WAL63_00555 [Solirubrobacteraceae bacterium]